MRRQKKTPFLNAALLLISLLFSLYLVEAALGALDPVTLSEIRRVFGAPDGRTKARVVADYRDRGIATYPNFPPYSNAVGAADFRFGGVAKVLTVSCAENGYWTHYVSDRFGFNNPDAVWDADAIDIVAVGDSFTQGFCVFNDDHYLAPLRNRYKVLNLGLAGSDTLAEYAVLREYFHWRKAKILLVQYFEDDIADADNNRNRPVLARYLADDDFSQGLMIRSRAVNAELRARLDRLLASEMAAPDKPPFARIVDFALLRKTRHLFSLVRVTQPYRAPCTTAKHPPLEDTKVALFGHIVDKFAAVAKAYGAKLVFGYFPSFYELACDGYRSDFPQVHAVLAARNVALVDIREAFRGEDIDNIFPYRGFAHYTPEGNRLAGAYLLGKIDALLKLALD